jgi:CrcB protein
MLVWLGVAALGGVGAVARYLVITAVPGREFPWGTLAVNLSGAFLLGLLDGADLTGDAILLAGTATLGSYTTFSTWMLESSRLGGARRWLNLAVSLFAGLAAVAAGHALGAAL